jgi:flagellin-like hook-associated protein FlgL
VDLDDGSADGVGTATALGLRTYSADTRIDAFNDGRGVQIVTGGKDPVTGLPDPARDVDFEILLGDGTELAIDLAPEDILTVGTVLAAINTQAAPQLAAAGLPPTAFEARLNTESGGIELFQDTSVATLTGPIGVVSRNSSPAALGLGLIDRSYDASTGTLLGEDRAQVRNLNAFTALLDLRESLQSNDSIGIGLAGERIEAALEAMTQTRGLFGGYDRRVTSLTQGEEDRQVLDETIRSSMRDADFAEVATRFSLLQTQLQAGYRVVAQSSQLSLLDFLG